MDNTELRACREAHEREAWAIMEACGAMDNTQIIACITDLRRRLSHAEAQCAEMRGKLALADQVAEALDILRNLVGLTAFKHEGQRAALQEAMDLSGSIATRYRTATAPTPAPKGKEGDE